MAPPKKWWWLVLVVVPIVVALISLLKTGGGGGDVYNVAGNQYTGDVAFNPVTVIIEQARRIHGQELTKEVEEVLQKASNSVGTEKFPEAVSLLESVADSIPVPAFFNNLGAAYMATGEFDKAKLYLDKAAAAGPDKNAQFNLAQLPECGSLVGAKGSMPSGGDSFEDAEAIAPGLYIHNEGLSMGVHSVHKYFKVRLKAGRTLVSTFRTPNRPSYAGARIYDKNGVLLTQQDTRKRRAFLQHR